MHWSKQLTWFWIIITIKPKALEGISHPIWSSCMLQFLPNTLLSACSIFFLFQWNSCPQLRSSLLHLWSPSLSKRASPWSVRRREILYHSEQHTHIHYSTHTTKKTQTVWQHGWTPPYAVFWRMVPMSGNRRGPNHTKHNVMLVQFFMYR